MDAIIPCKPSVKKVKESSEKLGGKARFSRSWRNLDAPDAMGVDLKHKLEKRNVRTSLQKTERRHNRLPKTVNLAPLSLESKLDGKSLDGDQIKKKKMLEVSILREGGESVSLSQHLHENGFTYESQASLVSVKKVRSYIINYLVALFFKECENPLIDDSLDKGILKRVSDKWTVLKDIVREETLNITAEQAVLNFFKHQGNAFESLIIFLDLFESKVSFFGKSSAKMRKYPRFEKLKYPFSKTQLIRDIVEVSKGGNVSVKGFVQTFMKTLSVEVSEWESLTSCLWQDLFEALKTKSKLDGYALRHDKSQWKIISDNGLVSMKRELTLVSQENLEIKKVVRVDEENKKLFIVDTEMRSSFFKEGAFVVSDLSTSEEVLLNYFIKCVKTIGGNSNKYAFMECLRNGDFNLDGERITLLNFISSKQGGGLSLFDAIGVIVRLIGTDGGSKNKDAFVECLSNPEIALEGKYVSLYTFLTSDMGGCLSANEAMKALVKCIGHHGGFQSKKALMNCFCDSKINVDGKMMSLYTFLNSKCEDVWYPSEIIQVLVKFIGTDGGIKNYQAFMECFNKTEIEVNGQMVTLYAFLRSKHGGVFSSSGAVQVVVKCIGRGGGSKNKQALVECLVKPEVDLDGKIVTVYDFLMSNGGGGLSAYEAMIVISRCVGHAGGTKNKAFLIDCFKVKFKSTGCNLSLFELFLSARMTGKEAIDLCLIFSINRYSLNKEDVLSLFSLNKKSGSHTTVAKVFESFHISCYKILFNLVAKILGSVKICTESKRACFKSSCRALVEMFLYTDSFFGEKIQQHPNWSVAALGKSCINACTLYLGEDIHHELKEREKILIDWISQYVGVYRLTKKSLGFITNVQSLAQLQLLTDLCSTEISLRRRELPIDTKYCEDSLMYALQILIVCGEDTLQAIIDYKSTLLKWFDLKELSRIFTRKYNTIRIDRAVHYFFKNAKNLKSLISCFKLKKIFLIYIGMSFLTPILLQPLTLEKIRLFFNDLGEKCREELIQKKYKDLYALYAIYNSMIDSEKKEYFHEIVEGIPKIFDSYNQFQHRYRNKIQKKEWPLLVNLAKKWDLNKTNVTQKELMFLIRIRYQFFKKIGIAWSDISQLEEHEKRCCVVNKTVYPNWVFALAYLQKVRDYLFMECSVSEKKGSIVFESCDIFSEKDDKFSLFKIQLCKEGFLFEDESLHSVKYFYSKSKLDKCIEFSQNLTLETDQGLDEKPSGDQACFCLHTNDDKKLLEGVQDGIGLAQKSRKRAGVHIETELPQPKEIREKGQVYPERSQKQGAGEKIEMVESPIETSEEETMCVDRSVKEDSPMFLQLDDFLLPPLFEFNDQDINSLSPILSDSFYDVLGEFVSDF